jgi:hypothetical protein
MPARRSTAQRPASFPKRVLPRDDGRGQGRYGGQGYSALIAAFTPTGGRSR